MADITVGAGPRAVAASPNDFARLEALGREADAFAATVRRSEAACWKDPHFGAGLDDNREQIKAGVNGLRRCRDGADDYATRLEADPSVDADTKTRARAEANRLACLCDAAEWSLKHVDKLSEECAAHPELRTGDVKRKQGAALIAIVDQPNPLATPKLPRN